MPDKPLTRKQIRQARGWMTLVLFGLLMIVLGVDPGSLGLDRSPVIGFVQIGVWLTGLALLLIGATMTVRVVRNGRPNTLRSEIGLRLLATGYVFSVAASFADFLGIGAQGPPDISFGPLQVVGFVFGVLVSLLGLILFWPRDASKSSSDLASA